MQREENRVDLAPLNPGYTGKATGIDLPAPHITAREAA
jgi:hypothetical protein